VLNERIRELRSSRGMKQSELAKLVGMNQTQISKVERGERKLKADEVAKFAKALHVPIAELYEESAS